MSRLLTERKMRLTTVRASRTKRPSCTNGLLQSMPTTESRFTCGVSAELKSGQMLDVPMTTDVGLESEDSLCSAGVTLASNATMSCSAAFHFSLPLALNGLLVRMRFCRSRPTSRSTPRL